MLDWVQIFIPDGQSAGSVGKGYDLATAEERDMARERAMVQVGGPAQQGSPQREEEQLPEWWNPTPALHVSLYYKEEVNALSLKWTGFPGGIEPLSLLQPCWGRNHPLNMLVLLLWNRLLHLHLHRIGLSSADARHCRLKRMQRAS